MPFGETEELPSRVGLLIVWYLQRGSWAVTGSDV